MYNAWTLRFISLVLGRLEEITCSAHMLYCLLSVLMRTAQIYSIYFKYKLRIFPDLTEKWEGVALCLCTMLNTCYASIFMVIEHCEGESFCSWIRTELVQLSHQFLT